MFRRPLLALLALLLAVPASARAQFHHVQLLGARVRVTAPPVRPDAVTGVVTRYEAEDLVVRDEATGMEQTFPLHSVSLLEISRGSSHGAHARQRATFLAFLGGGLGAIAGALIQPIKGVGASVAALAGGGALLGGVVGAAWGSSASGERWEMAVRPWGYRPDAPLSAPPATAPPATAPSTDSTAPTTTPASQAALLRH
ncbi:MAG: hypothetical protein JO306_16645 [Gemmatimonadetes bacterium]|nr:hypothetical protein [Gemmatimonadota bacterium]